MPKLEFYLDEQHDQVASVIDALNALQEEDKTSALNLGETEE